MKRRNAAGLLAVAVWGLPLAGQETSPSSPLAFDVASVRLSPPGSSGMTSISPPGSPSFIASNVSLQILIAMAYGVDSDLVAGPSWLGSQQYDVSARTESNARLSYEQLKPLLRRLLKERFQLAVHTQTREASGYALVVAKGEARLSASKGGAAHSYILKGGIDIQNEPLSALAAALTRPAGRPVVDTTGITGNFDIRLSYAPEGAVDSPLPSLFTALQEQLGLKLVAQKVPVEGLVVDHVEKVPTEN